MHHKAEIFTSAIVVLGAFNPTIFSPDWLSKQGLIGADDAAAAREGSQGETLLVSHQLTTVETHVDELGLARRLLGEVPLDTRRRGPTVDSTPLQIWEGTVLDVDDTAQVMHVLLDAKMDDTPRHTGEIDLEWVAEQDRDLVQPGAVFYLTLFKRTTRGSVQNAQELRFRRRPAWSRAQIKQIERDAAMLHAKMKPAPTAP